MFNLIVNLISGLGSACTLQVISACGGRILTSDEHFSSLVWNRCTSNLLFFDLSFLVISISGGSERNLLEVKTDDDQDFSEMMAEVLFDVLTTIYDGNNYDYNLLWQQWWWWRFTIMMMTISTYEELWGKWWPKPACQHHCRRHRGICRCPHGQPELWC